MPLSLCRKSRHYNLFQAPYQNRQKSTFDCLTIPYPNFIIKPHPTMTTNDLTPSDYTVGWMCLSFKELEVASTMLDHNHAEICFSPDTAMYTLGSMGHHNIVIDCPLYDQRGAATTKAAVDRMIRTFPSIKLVQLVGAASGVPPRVKLGDVVVSIPPQNHLETEGHFGEGVEEYIFTLINPSNTSSFHLQALNDMRLQHMVNEGSTRIPQTRIPTISKRWSRDILI